MATSLEEEKLNFNLLNSALELTLCHILLVTEILNKYIPHLIGGTAIASYLIYNNDHILIQNNFYREIIL